MKIPHHALHSQSIGVFSDQTGGLWHRRSGLCHRADFGYDSLLHQRFLYAKAGGRGQEKRILRIEQDLNVKEDVV